MVKANLDFQLQNPRQTLRSMLNRTHLRRRRHLHQHVRFIFIANALFFVTLVSASLGDQPKEPVKEEIKANEPIIVKVDGTFESPATIAIKAGTKEIKSLAIERIVAHGTVVEKGQNLVWFKTEDVDQQIADAELDLQLAEVALNDAEFKFKQFQESQKLDREAAERTRVRAREDYDQFIRVDREQQIKSTEFNLSNVKASLENAEEELAQLEKMYLEDDLTEESEEIVLKRARQAVDQAKFRLQSSELQAKQTLEKAIPRLTLDQESGLARAEMTYQSTISELDFARKRREIEITKERRKFKEQDKKVKALRAERKQMVLVAPQAGIFLHGTLTRGAIGDKASTMETGSSVSGDQVIGAVAAKKPLHLRVSIPEDQLQSIQVGRKATVIASAFPDHPLEAIVKSLSSVPYANRQFDCVLTVKLGKLADSILPTMNARAEFEIKQSDTSNPKADITEEQ
jgi:hypothetical protein